MSQFNSHETTSTSSSCIPSTSCSVVDPSTSDTSHSTLEDKPRIKRVISSSGEPSGDIFSLSDQQLSEKLRFIQEIGFGNWGSVWLCEPRLAEDRRMFGDRVAVKLVHRSKTPTTTARVRSLWNEMKIVRALRREASASNQEVIGVGHASIVQFHSFVITPSYALITMQYLPTPVPVEVPEFRAKPWFAALTDALAFLHQRGVVHNDIKPANILLTGGASHPMPVLVDFGFAESYTPSSRHAFQSNLAYGTPEYLAPERARGQPHDTRKSDVYALGVTFFEILVGRTPFEEIEGESFVSKEDLERYWARTVKGKWVGKWEGIMSKQCEKALKRMTAPNADLRVTAVDVLDDPYFTDEEEANRSNLSVDLSALSEMIPPWSRPVLAPSKRDNSNTKNVKSGTSKRSDALPTPIRVAQSTPKIARAADKENAQPTKSDNVNLRGGTLRQTSKSITEVFRRSVGVSQKVPKKAAMEVFKDETPTKVGATKSKNTGTVLKAKNTDAAQKDKGKRWTVSKDKKAAPAFKERSTATPTKREPVRDKENAKPRSIGRTLSMTLSFRRPPGPKKAKEQEQLRPEANAGGRESLHVTRTPSTSTTRAAVVSPTPSEAPRISPVSAQVKAQGRTPFNPRDVRTVFNIAQAPSLADASFASEVTCGHAAETLMTTHTAPSSVSNPEPSIQNTNSEKASTTLKPDNRSNTLCGAGAPHLSPMARAPPSLATFRAQNFMTDTDSATPSFNQTRVSRITDKESRRTNLVAKPSARGAPTKRRQSPSRAHASPTKTKAQNNHAPIFAVLKEDRTTTKVAVKARPMKVLGDATNVTTPAKTKKASRASKFSARSKAKADDGHDEGDDTITSPIEVFQNNTLPCLPRSSSKSGFRQSLDKALRFGRSSVSATESTHHSPAEVTQHRRSLSLGEAWGNDTVNQIISSSMPAVRHALQNEKMGPDGQVDRMAIWIRNVEKVVEDVRQSFQAEPAGPLALAPPPPRLNHNNSAGSTRISTFAKDPTIRTLTSDMNPSVTTFTGAPQAPTRARRATVGSASSPGATATFFFNTQTKSQGGLSRPITPCLNAEFAKGPPSSPTPPRLSEIFDSDSRKLILAPIGMSETPSYPLMHERSASATGARPKSQQSTRFLRTPSPSCDEPKSPTTASRPVTSMSANKSTGQAGHDYDRYLTTDSAVIRNGKGYQSELVVRGRGIENIPSKPQVSPPTARKRSSVFNRLVSSNHGDSERTSAASRVANAFRTIVAGNPKKREPIGIINNGTEVSRKAQTWSRAQAI